MNFEDEEKDQDFEETPTRESSPEPSIYATLRDLSRNPQSGGMFVDLSSFGPISFVYPSSPEKLIDNSNDSHQPDPTKEQLKASLIDFLDSMVNKKPPNQAPGSDFEDAN